MSCQSLKKSNTNNYLKMAIEGYFDGEVDTVNNTTATFILITQKHKSSMQLPVNALKYGIYDTQKKKMVHIEEKYNAEVSWYNDEYILVKSRPGVKSTNKETDNSMKHYYINVNTLEKLTRIPN